MQTGIPEQELLFRPGVDLNKLRTHPVGFNLCAVGEVLV
jgi:hypothetical protein